jgi:GH25 family lysozyme M1 (1,4-beta-N-acetylmuramidase)
MFQASDDLVFGVDVSHFNDPKAINYAQASQELAFAIIRVAYGAHHFDACAAAHAQGFASQQIAVSFYLFALMDEDPHANAQTLYKRAIDLGWKPTGALPLSLDVELPPDHTEARAVHDKMGKEERVTWLTTCLRDLDALCGRSTGIYSGPGYWNRAIDSPNFANRPYWAARYPSSQLNPDPRQLLDRQPASTTGWGQGYTIWQYTNLGSMAGYGGKVDKSVMRRSDLRCP